MKIFYGEPGNGKEDALLRELIQSAKASPRKRFFVVVPEQFTSAMEQRLIEMHPDHAFMNIEVTGFRKLARDILEAGNDQVSLLNDLQQELILRKVLMEERDKLKFFRGNQLSAGFIEELKTFLMEIEQNGFEPKDFFAPVGKTGFVTLEHKLNDIGRILTAYRNSLEKHQISPNQVLSSAAAKIGAWKDGHGASFLWIGHAVFDREQYALISALIDVAEEAQFVFDGGNVGETPVFGITDRTMDVLERMSDEKRMSTGRTYHSGPVSPIPDSLRVLRDNLFRTVSIPSEIPGKEIRITTAKTITGELEHAAGTIRYLVRQEGYHYRDFAVICDILGQDRKIIERIFERERIPFFIDQMRTVLISPLLSLLGAALKIQEEGPKRGNVIALIKTRLILKDAETVARVENRIRKFGMDRYKDYDESDDPEKSRWEGLEDSRQKIRESLRCIQNMNRSGRTVSKVLDQLKHWLQNLGVEEALEELSRRLEEDDLYRAQQYDQLYERFVEIMEAIGSVLGNEPDENHGALKLAYGMLRDRKPGAIPQHLDEVLVGDVSRSMYNEKKIIFFIQMNLNEFLNVAESRAIFNPQERAVLKDAERLKENLLDLDQAGAHDPLLGQLRLYQALSRVTEKAEFSYSLANLKGENKVQDLMVDRILKLFPDVKPVLMKDAGREYPANGKQLLDLLVRKRKKGDFDVAPVLRLIAKDARYAAQGAVLARAFTEKKPRHLSEESVNRLYEGGLNTSISRLESFHACPFQYFMRYNMKVEPTEEFEIRPLDFGTLGHDILEQYFRGLVGRKVTMPADVAVVEEEVNRLVEARIGNYPVFVATARHRYLLDSLKRILVNSILVYRWQLASGDFKIRSIEEEFHAEDMIAGRPVTFRGKIDRTDIWNGPEGDYIRVMDYKSSGKDIDPTLLEAGISLQLFRYADEVADGSGGQLAGVHYLKMGDPWIAEDGKSRVVLGHHFVSKEMGLTGYVLEEENVKEAYMCHRDSEEDAKYLLPDAGRRIPEEAFRVMKQMVRNRINEAVERIFDGDISVEPYRYKDRMPCKRCDFKTVCGYDPKDRNMPCRSLEEKKLEDLMETDEETTEQKEVDERVG